jgi:hypothetical protein
MERKRGVMLVALFTTRATKARHPSRLDQRMRQAVAVTGCAAEDLHRSARIDRARELLMGAYMQPRSAQTLEVEATNEEARVDPGTKSQQSKAGRARSLRTHGRRKY